MGTEYELKSGVPDNSQVVVAGQSRLVNGMDCLLYTSFIPIKNTSMEEAIELSKKVAAKVAEIYHLPVFLYAVSYTHLDVYKRQGYTRIIKTGNRLGDNAEMCFIELVEDVYKRQG